MARYSEKFKARAVARLLLPESAAVDVVAREVGIGSDTLIRWRDDLQSMPARGRAWTAAARLEAVIFTAALDETSKNAWCRKHGVYPAELLKWRASATSALAEPEEIRANPQTTRVAAQGPGSRRNGGPPCPLKKSRGDLQQGRGRMIGLEDRQALARDIAIAHAAGARRRMASETAGIKLRTLQRWQAAGEIKPDGRPVAVRAAPRHALSEAERTQVLAVANEPRFATVPPARIVPMLADEGVYLASESTFYRLLHAHGRLVASSRRTDKRRIADGPRHRSNDAHPPHTLRRHFARSGAGT